MTVFSILRRIVLAALVGFAAGGVCADDDKLYEGLLLPDDFAGPVAVTVELRDLRGVLVGRVKAGSPLSSVAPVSAGTMSGDKCDFTVTFAGGTTLRFTGTCQTAMFEGKYAQPGRRDPASRGSFRLMRKEPEKDDDGLASRSASISTTSLTDCISANHRCLTACPQGDYNAEFLCANRCRSKYKSCKKSVQQ